MDEIKLKEKGNVKNTKRIIANGIQVLDGEKCHRSYRTPIILLDYDTPVDAHPFAKGERFAFWCKLEDAQYNSLVNQLKGNLRELTFWFDKENLKELQDFLNKINPPSAIEN